jgi:hypothetical protein
MEDDLRIIRRSVHIQFIFNFFSVCIGSLKALLFYAKVLQHELHAGLMFNIYPYKRGLQMPKAAFAKELLLNTNMRY